MGFTVAFNVPPDGVMLVVGCDVTVGALAVADVVNDKTEP